MSESTTEGNVVAESETTIGLTTFADTTDTLIENTEHPIYGPLVAGNSVYELDNLESILGREYRIDTINWTSTLGGGAPIAVYKFPQVLFNNTTIQDKLRTFDLFRAGVEVSFRVNATDFHYGTLLVAHVPHYDPTDFPVSTLPPYENTNKLGNIFTASNNKCILISANSRDVVTIRLPYRAPYPWIDLQDWATGVNCRGAIGSIVVFVMNPLRVTNVGTPALSVSVFARFIQPEASGNTGKTRTLTVGVTNEIGSFIPQSSEQRVRSEKETVSSIALSTGKKLARNILVPMVGGQVRAVAGAVRLLGDVLDSAGFDQPTSTSAPAPIKLVTSGNTAFGKGLDCSNKLSLDPENHVDSAVSSMEYRRNETSIKNMCMIPTYLGTITIDDSNTSDMCMLTMPVCPMLSATANTTFSTTSLYKFYPGYSAYWSNLFSYWRGSMKYRFHFVGSKFGTARVRIGWYPHSDEGLAGVVGNAGDYISKIVDICGDTTVDFCIPYCQSDVWKKAKEMVRFKGTGSQYLNKRKANGILFVMVVNPPEVPTTTDDSTIYMNIWQAAGEDLEFGKYGMLAPSVATDSRYVSQCDVAEVFNQTFESLVPAKFVVQQNVQMGEHIDDVKTLLHRAYPRTNVARSALPNTTDITNPLADTTTTSDCLANYICRLYGGWRGSVRHKLMVIDGTTFQSNTIAPYSLCLRTAFTAYDGAPATTGIVSNPNHDALAGGAIWIAPSVTPFAEVEVPYYEETNYCVPMLSQTAKTYAGSAQYYANLTPRTTLSAQGSIPMTALMLRMFSVGDDFELGMLMAPPALYAMSGT